ncbi:MAG: DnaK suppressor protein [Cocleimonas sp.]|jgi:DnaK suppressor protein
MNNSFESDKKSLLVLMQLEDDLSKRLKKLSIDLSKSHSRDSSEQAIERENDEVINSLESETQDELQQVRTAINRIKQGSYLTCEKCNEVISTERLRVIPYTSFCLKCASSQEL